MGMSFTVQSYKDMIQLLQGHPEFRAELRQIIYPQETLESTRLIQDLIEKYQHLEQSIKDTKQELGQRIDGVEKRLEQRIDGVEKRLEQRIDRVEKRLDDFATETRERFDKQDQRIDRVEKLLDNFAAETRERFDKQDQRFDRVEKRLDDFIVETRERFDKQDQRFDKIETALNDIRGQNLETEYRQKSSSYFGRVLRNTKIVDVGTLSDKLESYIDDEEFDNLLQLDLLVSGRSKNLPDKPTIWLAVEISYTINNHDIERAMDSAAILRKADYFVVPVVCGKHIGPKADDLAQQHAVLVFNNGRFDYWNEAVARYVQG